MTARRGWAVIAVPLFGLLGCGGGPAPRPPVDPTSEPHWQDVLETTPELLVVVRPRALRQDKVYGPLLRHAIEVARANSPVVAASGALDAIESAGELVIAVRPDAPDRPGELVLVERGVPADLDPGVMVDDQGHTLWTAGPAGRVRELVRERDDHGHPLAASLFELPGRTWVIASGDARARAREAFAHPFGRPPMELDPTALAIVRIDGPSLVARVRALQDLGGLASLGRHLRSVTFTLPPAGGSVSATFAYTDEDSAALADVATREVIGAVQRAGSKALPWLVPAKVARAAKQVVLTAPLPASLVDGLLKAGSVPLDVDVPVVPGPH